MSRSVNLAQRAKRISTLSRCGCRSTSPATALQYIVRTRAFIAQLGDFPERGTAHEVEGRGLRVIALERRIEIAFVVRTDRVDVQRVFYGGQNWQHALRSSKRRD